MTIFQLAWKNISGNAFRNGVLLVCALLLSSFALFTTLVIRGAENSLRLTIDRLGADVIVVPKGSEAEMEGALLMGTPAKFWMPKSNVDKIAALESVEIASPQLYLATLSGASCCSFSDMFIIAYDPATDFTIHPWLKKKLGNGLQRGEVVGGNYVHATEGENNLRVYGYPLTLKEKLEPTGTGLDQTLFFTFETAYDVAKKSYVQAEKPLEIPPDSVSAVLIRVKPGIHPYNGMLQIIRNVPGVEPIESSNLFQSYRKQVTSLLKGVLVILGVTWGLSVVLIGLVFSMAANERRKELGVLRSLGATRRFVFQSLMVEASILAFLGGIIGLAVTGLAIFLFRDLIMVSLEIPFLFPSPIALLFQIGAGLLLALVSVNLAALFPAIKISRQDPADAMRE